MFKILKILTLTLVMLGALLIPSAVAFADCNDPNLTAQQALQCGATSGTPNAAKTSAQAANNLNTNLGSIINILSIIVSIIAVIMVIIGGFKYVTSGGNQEAVGSAKRTILYAAVGLVIVAVAQTLVKFVINRITKT